MSPVLDKRILKAQLETFFDLIFYCLESENGLASYSAEQCLQALSSRLGPNILKGRIENYNPKYLHIYNQKVLPGVAGISFSVPGGQPGAMTVQQGLRGMPTAAVSIPGSGRQGTEARLGGTPT